MPSWAKVGTKLETKLETKVEAPEPRELTYEVLSKRAAVRFQPNIEAAVLVLLHKGERVTGCLENGWLRLSRATVDSHPHRSKLMRAEAAFVAIESDGRGPQLKRAPAELGWVAASEEITSDVFEVVGSSDLLVTVVEEDGEEDLDYLSVGALVKVLERKGQRLRFELLAGEGPTEGWVENCSCLVKVSSRTAPQAQATVEDDAPPQDAVLSEADLARSAAALQRYGEMLEGTCTYNRCPFAWTKKETAKKEEISDVVGALERELAAGWAALKPVSNACHTCGLPLGPLAYLCPEGDMVHAECMAQVLLQEAEHLELERVEAEKVKKQLRRKEYGIGWRKEMLVTNVRPLKQLTGRNLPHGLCALALAAEGELTIVPTASPKAAVNLEYLSIALKVRRDEGREPLFSLDPVDPALQDTMQVKRFEPWWLKSTSAGDVLFESDYHLKELSMGEYEQPVVGMKSAFYYSDQECKGLEWSAREWFVVRAAEVWLSEDGVLVPHCRMGVEAREQKLDKEGHLQDERVTRDNHPLVKYADEFTKNFQLIAERKSVFHELRELAKASVMAKYLMTSKQRLADGWFELFEEKDTNGILEVPQLWQERGQSQIHVNNGKIINEGETQLRAVYGGVSFGLHKFRMAPSSMSMQASGSIQARRGFTPSGAMVARRGLFHLGGPAAQRIGPMGPRGVDFNLDKFALGKAKFSLDETDPGPVNGPMALGEDLSECACVGRCFWKELDGTGGVFNEQQRNLLRRIFNEQMSDRRMEGELFTPPEDLGSDKVRQLLDEEQRVCQRRQTHFCSVDFSMGAAGPLFPDSWTSDFEIAAGREPRKQVPQPAGQLEPRPEYLVEEGRIRQALECAAPIFDRTTEDGCRFRIYRFGSLEVRTTQDLGSAEALRAVFSIRAATPPAGPQGTVSEDEHVANVVEYVERDPESTGSRLEVRYYVQLETDQGNIIVSERLKDGSVAWRENPANAEDRSALARVLCAEDGSGVTIRELRDYGNSSSTNSQDYADGFFGLAAGASKRKQQPLGRFFTPAQRLTIVQALGDPVARMKSVACKKN